MWQLRWLHVGGLQHLQAVQGQEEERVPRHHEAGLRPEALPPDPDRPVAAERDEEGGAEDEEGVRHRLARLLAGPALRHQPAEQEQAEEDAAQLGRHLAHLPPRGQPAPHLARLHPRGAPCPGGRPASAELS